LAVGITNFFPSLEPRCECFEGAIAVDIIRILGKDSGHQLIEGGEGISPIWVTIMIDQSLVHLKGALTRFHNKYLESRDL
jgi:hypothetical protein